MRLLRQFHRPVHRLRVSKETTEPVKFGRQDLWKVGRALLPEKEAIKLARHYLTEEYTPRWGVTLKKERNITNQLFKKH